MPHSGTFVPFFFYVFIVVKDDDDVLDENRYSSVECKVNIILSDSDSSDLLTFRLGQRRVVLIRFDAVTPCFFNFHFFSGPNAINHKSMESALTALQNLIDKMLTKCVQCTYHDVCGPVAVYYV